MGPQRKSYVWNCLPWYKTKRMFTCLQWKINVIILFLLVGLVINVYSHWWSLLCFTIRNKDSTQNWHLWLSRNRVIKTQTIPGSPGACWPGLYASYGWDALACGWVSQVGLVRRQLLDFHPDPLLPGLPPPPPPPHCLLWRKITIITNILWINIPITLSTFFPAWFVTIINRQQTY